MTKSVNAFIEDAEGIVILSTQSAVYIGRITFKDGIHERVEVSDCIIYAGNTKTKAKQIIIKKEEIISWGIPE